MNDWITSTEAAAMLGVSDGLLRKRSDEDQTFPRPYRPGARKLLWSRAAIAAYRDKSIVAQLSTHIGAVKSKTRASTKTGRGQRR